MNKSSGSSNRIFLVREILGKKNYLLLELDILQLLVFYIKIQPTTLLYAYLYAFFIDDLDSNINCNRLLCPACLAGQLR